MYDTRQQCIHTLSVGITRPVPEGSLGILLASHKYNVREKEQTTVADGTELAFGNDGHSNDMFEEKKEEVYKVTQIDSQRSLAHDRLQADARIHRGAPHVFLLRQKLKTKSDVISRDEGGIPNARSLPKAVMPKKSKASSIAAKTKFQNV